MLSAVIVETAHNKSVHHTRVYIRAGGSLEFESHSALVSLHTSPSVPPPCNILSVRVCHRVINGRDHKAKYRFCEHTLSATNLIASQRSSSDNNHPVCCFQLSNQQELCNQGHGSVIKNGSQSIEYRLLFTTMHDKFPLPASIKDLAPRSHKDQQTVAELLTKTKRSRETAPRHSNAQAEPQHPRKRRRISDALLPTSGP